MPALIALVGLLTAAAFFLLRARNAAQAAGDLVDMAQDARAAARRFGFRRRANVHPVESIEDPAVAIATLSVAFLELDALPSREQQLALGGRGLQRELNLSLTDAEELVVLGRWMMTECGGGAEQAVTRVARKLYKLDAGRSFPPLMGVVKEITAEGQGLSPKQTRALEDIKTAFRLG